MQESMPDCSADSSSEVSSKRGTIHPVTVATTQVTYRQQEKEGQNKNPEYEP